MKRSGRVGLTLMTALGLASCGRSTPPPQRTVSSEPPPPSQATMTWDNKPRDPCAQQYFDQSLCQGAIQNRGYHYGGSWIPMMYMHPYSHYYSSHTSYLSSGGRYSATPVEVYHSGFKAPAAGSVVKGGFGTTASAMRSSSSSSGSSHSSSSSGHSSSSSGHSSSSGS